MHGRETGRHRLRPEFAIWPSGAWPLLPPATRAQAQELARSVFIEESRRTFLRHAKSRGETSPVRKSDACRKEAANVVVGGLQKRKAQRLLGFVFLVAAAIVL